MESIDTVVTILTAMITPSVLISACAGLVLSTTTRLGRVAEHVRALSEKFDEISGSVKPGENQKEQVKLIFTQLDKLTIRARILQRAVAILHCAIGAFISTSILVGCVALTGVNLSFLPVATGLVGACLVFYASVTLMYEAHLSLLTIKAEMNFIWHLAERHAPAELARHKKAAPVSAMT